MDVPPSESSYFSKTNILIYLLVADILIKLLWMFSIFNFQFMNMGDMFFKKKLHTKLGCKKKNCELHKR